jgi:glycosyltransferase involved in cell wall biosynthesis
VTEKTTQLGGDAPHGPCIAYLTSQYPALSHTFIRREIAALRALGLRIAPFSVRPSTGGWEEDVPAILGRSRTAVLAAALRASLARPGSALRSLRLTIAHREAGLRGLVWAMFHWVEALALARMLIDEGARHLHVHFANSGAKIGMLAANYCRLPFSFTLHGISETDPPAGALLPGKLERASFVACASWFMRAQAMRVSDPRHWERFHLVRCGVTLPDRAALPPPPTAIRHIVSVGRLSAEKGFPLLVKAMGELRKQSCDARLTIIGDGPLRTALEAEIARQDLRDKVKLTGALPEDETLAQIAAADAFVLSSLMEGLPVVLMEAMAACKPVIAPTVAGIPELVKDGRTGLTFDPGSAADLARAMKTLLSDAALASRLGKAGRARIEEEFAIERAVRPLAALLRDASEPDQRL